MKKRIILWENVISVPTSVFAIERILRLIPLMGINPNIRIEIGIYVLGVIGVRYLVKSIRKGQNSWLFEEK